MSRIAMTLGVAVMAACALLMGGCRSSLPVAPGGTEPCPQRTSEWRLSLSWGPTWSPDGREVAFYSARSTGNVLNPGIYIADVQTQSVRKVYDEEYLYTPVMALDWAPRGDLLLASRIRWLYVFDLATRMMQPLNAPGEYMLGGAWSPEGDSIFYSREMQRRDGNHLYVTSPAGGIGRPFIPEGGAEIYPVTAVDFHPDGQWIAFEQLVRESDGTWRDGGEIFIIKRDGTGLRQLTNLRGFNAHPRWIDGGRAIVFDHLPEECYNTYFRPGHSWVVEPETGVIYRMPHDVGDRRVQSGYPPSLDRAGTRAAAIALDRETGYGALWLMSSHGTHRQLLYSARRDP